jgi:hypothetical protein
MPRTRRPSPGSILRSDVASLGMLVTLLHRPMTGLRLPITILSLGAACASGAGCTGESTSGPSGVSKFMRVVSAPESDTARAILAQPFVVEVNAPAGTPIVFRANVVERASDDRLFTGAWYSRTEDAPYWQGADTTVTDDSKRATTYVRLGPAASETILTAFAPTLDDSVQARVTVKPGAPVRVVVTPNDTAIYVGRRYSLQLSVRDANDNHMPATGATFTADSAATGVSSEGEISSRAIGRGRVRVRANERETVAWTSVVPEGRIAAVRRASNTDSTNLVLVNLDGSSYRTFRLPLHNSGIPAWHPDGSYLVASVLPPRGSSDPAARLARFDTATGIWTSIRGTQEVQGDGYAQFSRDGQWIYISNGAVSRVRADGTGPLERIGYDRATAVSFEVPSPSPDGSRVAMTVDVSSGFYTLIVSASPPLGRPPQEFGLVGQLPTGGYPRWSPVGDDLLMFGSEGMWLMRAGARTVAERRYLARDWSSVSHVTGGFAGASWSPDGNWVVARAAATLILVEVTTGRVLPLAFGTRLADPAWRPR